MMNRIAFKPLFTSLVALACVCIAVRADAQWFGRSDNTFGTLGRATAEVLPGTGNDEPRGLVLLPNGNIVAGGDCSAAFCLVQFLPNGTLDLSFGTNGVVRQTLTGQAIGYGLALQRDGKFVMVGECDVVNGLNKRFCVARFRSDGSLDPTFGAGTGWIEIDFSPSFDSGRAIAIQADGKIVVAGACFMFPLTGTRNDFCVARLFANGTLDTSFNGNGKLVIPRPGSDVLDQFVTTIAIDIDYSILVVGTCNGPPSFMCMIRVKEDGSEIDAAFGSESGWAKFSNPYDITYDTTAYSVVLQPSGKIVIGGHCILQPCVVRFLKTGLIDVSFGNEGHNVMDSNAQGAAREGVVRLRGDGAIILAGKFSVPNGGDGAIAQLFLSNGLPWPLAVMNRTTVASRDDGNTGWRDLAIQPDGKIVALRSCNGGDICVDRFQNTEREYLQCSADIDGDQKVFATTDGLINTRVALGMTGSNVIAGISFPANATRRTWPEIRSYLISQCGMAIP